MLLIFVIFHPSKAADALFHLFLLEPHESGGSCALRHFRWAFRVKPNLHITPRACANDTRLPRLLGIHPDQLRHQFTDLNSYETTTAAGGGGHLDRF